MGDDWPLFGLFMEYGGRQRDVQDAIIAKNEEKVRVEDDALHQTTIKVVDELQKLGISREIGRHLVYKQNQYKLYAHSLVNPEYRIYKEEAKKGVYVADKMIKWYMSEGIPKLVESEVSDLLSRLTYNALAGMDAEAIRNYKARLYYHELYKDTMEKLSNYIQKKVQG